MPYLGPQFFPPPEGEAQTAPPERKLSANAVHAMPADPETFGPDAWHIVDWDGSIVGTQGSRALADRAVRSRQATVKRMITRRSK